MRIYVGNLPYSVTDEELRQEFETYGQVESVSIPTDRDTGRSKGFGFIDMPNNSEAEAAIAATNGKTFKERTLTVSEARPRAESGGRGFGGGGGRGGGGGGRGPRRY